MGLGTHCFSPSHKPSLTKQVPCTGIPALLVVINIVFPWDALSCQRMSPPVSLVVPCFLCLVTRELHLAKGGLCSPDTCGKVFPNLALEETQNTQNVKLFPSYLSYSLTFCSLVCSKIFSLYISATQTRHLGLNLGFHIITAITHLLPPTSLNRAD